MIPSLLRPSILGQMALALLIASCLGAGATAQCQPCISVNFNKTLGGWWSSVSNPVCIQANSGTAARSICSVDLYMRARISATTLTISIYNSNGPWTANNPPLTSAQVAVSTTTQVYTARFTKPAIVPPKTIFYIVFDNATTVVWPVSSSGTAVPHRLKWNGKWYSVNKRPWGYRISCGTLPITASYAAYGAGCPTQKTPLLTHTGRPLLGTTFSADLANARASSAVLFVIGYSDRQWTPSIKLPLNLRGLGAPGCFLLCSIDAPFALATDKQGKARAALPIPSTRSLLGKHFYNQFFVIDKKVNALGMAASNGGKATIGNK